MPLNLKKDDMGDVIKDFYKSDAPQFKGKSKEKRRQMAIAAKLEAERGPVKEGLGLDIARAIDKTKPPLGRTSLRRKVSDSLKMGAVKKSMEKRGKSFQDFTKDVEAAKNKK